MGFTPQFTARIESRNGVARIALEGDLDMSTVPVLNDHLGRFEADGVAGIMLDLRDLSFVDCSGLRVFLAARERSNANGHRFIVVGANPGARRLFELTGTQFLVDEQEAVTLLDRFTRGGEGGAAQTAAVER